MPPNVELNVPPPVNDMFAPTPTVTPPVPVTTSGPVNVVATVTSTLPPLTVVDVDTGAFGPDRLSWPLVICSCTPAVVLNAALDATEQFAITIEPFVPEMTDAAMPLIHTSSDLPTKVR